MATEYLIWFSETETSLGVMPSHYMIAKGNVEVKAAKALGGMVVDSDDDWFAFEQQFRDRCEGGL